MVQLQPGLKLADVRLRGLATPTLRARTAREASASEGRRSPLNMLVMAVLVVFAVALLPIWRPSGPAGVPALTLTEAPQGLAHALVKGVNRGDIEANADVWAPQTWGSFLEWAVPEVRVAIDSRIELFPPPVLADAGEIATASTGWLSTVDVRKPFVLVVAADAPGERQRADLENSQDWKLFYEDDDGSIWLSTKPRRL
jgi:hypothetical protein